MSQTSLLTATINQSNQCILNIWKFSILSNQIKSDVQVLDINNNIINDSQCIAFIHSSNECDYFHLFVTKKPHKHNIMKWVKISSTGTILFNRDMNNSNNNDTTNTNTTTTTATTSNKNKMNDKIYNIQIIGERLFLIYSNKVSVWCARYAVLITTIIFSGGDKGLLEYATVTSGDQSLNLYVTKLQGKQSRGIYRCRLQHADLTADGRYNQNNTKCGSLCAVLGALNTVENTMTQDELHEKIISSKSGGIFGLMTTSSKSHLLEVRANLEHTGTDVNNKDGKRDIEESVMQSKIESVRKRARLHSLYPADTYAPGNGYVDIRVDAVTVSILLEYEGAFSISYYITLHYIIF